LGSSEAKLLRDLLKKNSKIRKLYIGGNKFGIDGASYLAEGLKENHVLTHISLHNNSLGDIGSLLIIESSKQNSNLANIYLGANSITENGAQLILAAIQNTFITDLDLNFNPNIEKSTLDKIKKTLEQNEKKLKHSEDNVIQETETFENLISKIGNLELKSNKELEELSNKVRNFYDKILQIKNEKLIKEIEQLKKSAKEL